MAGSELVSKLEKYTRKTCDIEKYFDNLVKCRRQKKIREEN